MSKNKTLSAAKSAKNDEFYTQYVAMEAFDPANGITQASHDNMTPEAWTN